jgi:predicted nuclease with TOPRIM domain
MDERQNEINQINEQLAILRKEQEVIGEKICKLNNRHDKLTNELNQEYIDDNSYLFYFLV